MGKLKALAGQTVIYGLSSILSRALNYLLVPLHTEVLLGGEYGIMTHFYAYIVFFNVLYTLGLETAFFRFGSREKEKEGSFFSTALCTVIFFGGITSFLLYLNADTLSTWLGYPDHAHIMLWLAIILLADAVGAIIFAKLRLDGKSVSFATIKIINIILTILLNHWFFVYADKDSPLTIPEFYEGELSVSFIFLANLIASLVIIPLAIIRVGKIKWTFSQEHLKSLLGYSWPLIFSGLAGATNEMLSRTMLTELLPEGFYDYDNKTALGIFGACYKLTVFINLSTQAFRYAAEPFFFSNSESKNSPRLFAETMHWFIVFGCLTVFSVSVNLDWLAPLILRDPIYLEGLNVVPNLLMASLLLGVYFNLSIWFKLTDKTKYGFYMATVGAVFTVLLNIILIPRLGYFGSSLVSVFVYSLMSLLSYWLGRKHYPIPYYSRDGSYLVLTGLSSYLIHEYLEPKCLTGLILGIIYLCLILLVERNRLPGIKKKLGRN